jgi:hypothetical protein
MHWLLSGKPHDPNAHDGNQMADDVLRRHGCDGSAP